MEGVERFNGMTDIYIYMTRLNTRELSKTRMDVEAVLMVRTRADRRKGVDTRTLSAEIMMDCGNCLRETPIFSFICFLKLKYYGAYTFIIQYDHLTAHLNLIKVTNHA